MYFRNIAKLTFAAVILFAPLAHATEFKLGILTPAKQSWTVESIEFAKQLKSESKGEHSIKVFHSAQLGNEAEMIRQLQAGTLDFALLTVSEIANRVVEFNALLAPGLVASNEQAAQFLKQGKEPQALLDILQNQIGVKGLAYGMAGVTQVMVNFDATSPADMSGKRVRITPSPAILEFNKLIGSAPVPIPLPGVYDAFSNGQVDGIETNLDIMRVFRLSDHAKTLLVTNQGMFPAVAVVSMKTWKGLSQKDQDLIARLAVNYGNKVIDATVSGEKKSLAGFEALDKLNVVHVAPEAFTSLGAKWDAAWKERLPQLEALRLEAKTLAN